MIGVLNRASATTLSRLDTCCTSFVNSVTKERCLVVSHGPNKELLIGLQHSGETV